MSPSREARRRAGLEALEDLRRYRRTIPLDRFLAERDEQRKVLHALFVALQACIDEAISECRRRGIDTSTYRGAFETLGQAKAFPSEWLPGLFAWASFRNIITHFYPVIDMNRVYQALSEIEVLEQFLSWSVSEDSGSGTAG
jgi:uncharacterized protein YutE (UPF0331/DUF86 family)